MYQEVYVSMSIFLKRVSIRNFKCFADKEISFSVPDGNEGSGLNILIGENGNGKTTVLESINYLALNTYSAENKLKINDFSEFREEIHIYGETNKFSCGSSIDFYKVKSWSFHSNGIEFIAKNRNRKESGKILSNSFQISNRFKTLENNYFNGNSEKEIDGRDKLFDNGRIINDALNIFYFDKNRTRQVSTGNYKTTFERICDDLNWKFVKNLDKDTAIKSLIEDICGKYFSHVRELSNKTIGNKIANEMKDFFDDKELKNLKIDLLNLLHPFSNSFFAIRNDSSLSQIKISDLGSGIEMILTLLMLKSYAETSKGSIIYLIDEPELHLHPKAQTKLFSLLLQESKTKQIIVSTHSPYFFKDAPRTSSNLILFNRTDDRQIDITYPKEKDWGLFPWSPSWGEINYYAFAMPSVEFHDELYGYLHELFIDDKEISSNITNKGKQTIFERCFLQKELMNTKDWTPECNGKVKDTEKVTLPTFIRNKTHHPENSTMKNDTFSNVELKESITEMIRILKKTKEPLNDKH